MKKVFLSIWLCLCLLMGTMSMAVAEPATFEIDQNTYYITLVEQETGTMGQFLGWKLIVGTSDSGKSYQQVDVNNDGTPVDAVFKPGHHPVTVFDPVADLKGNLTSGITLTFEPAYLDDGTDNVGGFAYVEPTHKMTQIPIYAKQVDKYMLDTPFVYKVELEWGDMQFAIGDMTDGMKIWNPSDHSYTWLGEHQPGEDEWYLVNAETYLGEGKDYINTLTNTDHRTQAHIVMFNHSNAPVDATVELEEVANEDTVAMGLSGEDEYGVSTTEQALADDGTADLVKYTVQMNAGVVNTIYDLSPDADACAVVKVWPVTDAADVNKDLFPVTTAVARLTITLNRTPIPADAIVEDPPATTADGSQS